MADQYKYISVSWNHDFASEPIDLVSELDANRMEIRKIEYFRDGTKGWACGNGSNGGTALGILPVPLDEEINALDEFQLKQIDSTEFEKQWDSR